jgi:hypothetical protein
MGGTPAADRAESMLADIGLTRSEIPRALRFGRQPHNFLD